MNSKCSPGPWEVKREGEDIVVMADGQYIATCHMTGFIGEDADPVGTTSANANMSAAAPEMYEALKACVSVLEDIKCGREWGAIEEYIEEAIDAIAKAEGKQ